MTDTPDLIERLRKTPCCAACGEDPGWSVETLLDEAAATLDAANARIAELEAEVSAWRQVQDAVAELEGHGPDWPSHGNAPLAVTAGYALHRQRAATARAEALEEAAAKADDWTLTAEEVANGTCWPANVGKSIGDAIRAMKGGSNG